VRLHKHRQNSHCRRPSTYYFATIYKVDTTTFNWQYLFSSQFHSLTLYSLLSSLFSLLDPFTLSSSSVILPTNYHRGFTSTGKVIILKPIISLLFCNSQHHCAYYCRVVTFLLVSNNVPCGLDKFTEIDHYRYLKSRHSRQSFPQRPRFHITTIILVSHLSSYHYGIEYLAASRKQRRIVGTI
jgi:hypothetical protein